MKLVRASCDCGFYTQKARSGYHFRQWWFPLYSTVSGTLTDETRTLPENDRKRIDQFSLSVFATIPPTDKAARRAASEKSEHFSSDVHATFLAQELQTLTDQYAAQDKAIFNPALESVFRCPQCGQRTLVLRQVHVVAFCKADCGHEYQWLDSEERGCPKCGYRPHAFRTEVEDQFADLPRTICLCPCSSSTDCTSHVDGYCPKCGGLADAYHEGRKHFCGKHHEVMLPYEMPGNFLFMEPEARWAANQFPNAKLTGDASNLGDSHSTEYCASCETDHQNWLAKHAQHND